MPRFATYWVVFLFILVTATAASAMTIRAVAEPSVDNINVAAGSHVRVNILMDNNDGFTRFAMSMPFKFFSPDESISAITHRTVASGYGPSGSILLMNGFDTWFNMSIDFEGVDWDGALPDTIGMGFNAAVSGGMPSGLGEQTYIRFYFIINQEGLFCIDSCRAITGAIDERWQWLFDSPSPSFNGPYCWNIKIVDDFVCGDANHDGNVNMLDVVFLIRYIYNDGLMPYPFEAGDVNASGSIEILDVTKIISYLYKGGPEPICIR